MHDLRKMIDTQNSVNTKTTGKDWGKKGHNWRRAILLEGAELVDSFPWKWWKHGSADIENAKVELVDIWHFVLSMMVEEEIIIDDKLEKELKAIVETDTLDHTSDLESVLHHMENVIKASITDKSSVVIAKSVMKAAGSIGMTFDDIQKLYFGKAVLNTFRQSNGYADGTYKKMWNGVEDNVVMAELINNIAYSNHFDDDLGLLLQERYLVA